MAKRGLPKGSTCLRRHKSGAKKGRCAEFAKKGKARKATEAPKKKRKGGGGTHWTSGWGAVARAAKKQQEAEKKAREAKLQENIANWVELHGARRRRR